MKRLLLLLSAFLLSINFSHAKTIDRNALAKIDSYVATLGPMEGAPLKMIVDTITASGHDQASTVRAIYYWVASNIYYDCKGYHHSKQYNGTPSGALTTRLATAEGYANLFQEMCRLAYIHCITIPGYAKFSTLSIGKVSDRERHTWNAVEIDNTWYMIDVTWGAGSTDTRRKRFSKNYTDAWFCTDRHLFALSHFPDDKKLQMLDTPINKSQFSNAPIIGDAAIVFDVYPIQARGNIRGREDTSKQMAYHVANGSLIHSVSVEIDNKVYPINYTVTNDLLTIDLPFPGKGKYPMILDINNAYAYGYNADASKKRKVKKVHQVHKKTKPKKPARPAPLHPVATPEAKADSTAK